MSRQSAKLARISRASLRGVNMMRKEITRLIVVKACLKRINRELDVIEKLDPYGDIVENFCGDNKTDRHTDRIIKMIEKDLKKALRKHQSQAKTYREALRR